METQETTSVDPTKQAVDPQIKPEGTDSLKEKPARSIEDYEKEIKELRAEAKTRRLSEKDLTEKLSAFEAEKLEREKALLQEQGKYQELYEKSAKELEDIKKALTDKSALADKYLEIETKKREDLLSKAPEDLREEIKDLSIDKLEKIIEKVSGVNRQPQGVPNQDTNLQNNSNKRFNGKPTFPFQGLD